MALYKTIDQEHRTHQQPLPPPTPPAKPRYRSKNSPNFRPNLNSPKLNISQCFSPSRYHSVQIVGTVRPTSSLNSIPKSPKAEQQHASKGSTPIYEPHATLYRRQFIRHKLFSSLWMWIMVPRLAGRAGGGFLSQPPKRLTGNNLLQFGPPRNCAKKAATERLASVVTQNGLLRGLAAVGCSRAHKSHSASSPGTGLPSADLDYLFSRAGSSLGFGLLRRGSVPGPDNH